ncbi:hypothetical protein SCHPADRAFT_495628 [Schizopora paradoxa]|uniref:Uncharacterized protein n=1 Tax=Schizopora paradoxa TaxID=27342 RepID=A0A0H2RN52_9AGAM|nr:hypothetical protein SCHPADRAFT_495628 [Schizopora paradoxa]
MSSLGHLSASPFATLDGNHVPRDSYPSNISPNSPGEQSALAAQVEGPYRDLDFESPPPSASSSREAHSMRSSRAFSTSTHQSHRATNNPYIVPQQPPTPYSDSRVTLNPYANAQRSLNPYLNAEPQTNPFADTHLFIDPQEEKATVQQVNSGQLWVEEPDISHVLAYLQRGSSATPVQNSTDDGHQSKNRLSEGSSTMEMPSSPPLAEAIAM